MLEMETAVEVVSEKVTEPMAVQVEEFNHNATDTQSESSNLVSIPVSSSKTVDLKAFTCRSEKLNLSFNVKVDDYTALAHQRCYVMTIHDLGNDGNQFQEFVHCDKMSDLKNRVVWLHVTLPGQELNASDLKLAKYPTFEEIADELLCVVDFLKIPQVVCMGDGVGASISTLFAIRNPNRCYGVILIEPIGSSANIFESIRFKLNNLHLLSRNKTNVRNSSAFNRFVSKQNQDIEKDSMELPLSEAAESKLLDTSISSVHNNRNLELLAESFFNRSCLLEKLKDLKVDALIAVGKNSASYGETKKFYHTLQLYNKLSPEKLVNTPFVEIDNVANLLSECPDRLAISFQYFLQGIGLISALPMRNVLRQSSLASSFGRSISIDEGDQPSNSSISESTSHSLNNI